MKLMQGDCLELMQAIPDGSVDMVLTDIPYGVVSRKNNGIRDLDKGTADKETFKLLDFLPEIDRVCSSGTTVIFCGKEQFSEIFSYFSKRPGTTRAIIWEKTNPSPMNGQHIYLSGVELAVWHKYKGAPFNARCKNTVFRHPNGSRKFHPTEKNHDLLFELIRDNSLTGATVLDPCMGSGSTGIASVEAGRDFIGIELDPGYFEIARKRIVEAEASVFANGIKEAIP